MSFLENPFEVLENIKLDFEQEIKSNESQILQIQNRQREIREQEKLENLSSNVFREELKRGSENIRKINQEIETLKDELKKIESKILNEQFDLFAKVQAAKESGISRISNSIPNDYDESMFFKINDIFLNKISKELCYDEDLERLQDLDHYLGSNLNSFEIRDAMLFKINGSVSWSKSSYSEKDLITEEDAMLRNFQEKYK